MISTTSKTCHTLQSSFFIFHFSFFIFTAQLSLLPAQPASFPRYPSPSPDGSQVAFSYAGDIWTVSSDGGTALRLTSHPAYEHTPRWSPDGAWIAFSGSRYGDDDIFLVPSGGGDAVRLTFMEVDDHVCDWTADSRAVIFSSRRDDRYPDWDMLYEVAVTGGTPRLIMNAFAREAVVSPDGSRLLYTRSGQQWWRRGYRGSGAGQVWEYVFADSSHYAVTDTGSLMTGDDFRRPTSRWSLWKGGNPVVTSERDGTANLWERLADGSWMQLTHYSGDGVRFPAASHDGSLIAYEQGLDVWLLRGGDSPKKLDILAPDDGSLFSPHREKFDNKADRLAFTPDGKQMLLEIRGEAFAGRIVGDDDKAARGSANNLSNIANARDGDFTVSPGGDSLISVSDRDGNRELYLVYSDDPDTRELSRALCLKLERLTDNPADDHSPRWSPSGSEIAFIRGKGDLYTLDLKTRAERLILPGWSMEGYTWSPDGKWFAYCRYDDDYNSDVWVMPSDGSWSYNVSRHPDEDELPIWSDDGKRLAFRSRRRANNWDIYFAFLTLADNQKTRADWAEDKRGKSDNDKAGDDKEENKKKKKEPEPVKVALDTTDLYQRVRAVTSLSGEEGAFALSPDGETFAFTSNHQGENDLFAIDWTGEKLERLSKGGENPRQISFSSDGKRVRYLDGKGRVHSVKPDGSDGKTHPFDARITIDPRLERRQKFGEIWRTLNDEFYDPEFHGRDWAALRDKYAGMIDAASTEEDFGDLMRLMFGELDASHMGYWSPGGERRNTGRLGLDFDFNAGGEGLLVSYVLPQGPCDRENTRVLPGERLLSVAGVRLTPDVNLNALLEETVGERVELIVSDGKKERRLVVRPTDARQLGDLRYDDWVRSRQAMVDSLSGGRLGYLHIRGMGEESLARFESELYSVANGRDGLVIDVRYNGGGWTTDYLLTMLQVKRHAVTYPRDGGPGYPQGRLPLYSWVKPLTVLCNEGSFSNAEIFSHAMKTLGRAKVIGVPTPGGVISTGGHNLLDGSGFRVPLRGWYFGDDPTPDPERRMEGNGAVPDVIVPLKPGQMAAGDDGQLRAAVGELLSEVNGE